jgi:hypothetical protein
MIDLSFRTIGLEVLAREWPVFAGGAAIQVYLAKRVYRSSHYSIQWIVFCASVAVIGIASIGIESTLATERLYRDIGEGAHVRLWEELELHLRLRWPPILGFGLAQLAVLTFVRRERAFLATVAVAGVMATWLIAIWLYTTPHQDTVLRLFLVPGPLGLVASLLGFSASTALWMMTTRWAWRSG